MGDSYRYPIFFESPGLDEEQNKKIENYFRIRRKSGGGDCSSVTKINDNVYSIAFKEQEAQQRVLQKSEHVLEFAGCPLVLTVHSSISFINTSTSGQSVRSKQDSSQVCVQRQHSVLASSLPPSGEDYELRPDTYLLRYLTECPNVWKELDREVSAMSCSAQLYPQEGRVVVRSLAQPGAVDEVRDWKAEVDRLFKNYLCHYEVNPHKIKALLQSCSSCQTTDEVKVYSEVGVAVVVGECSQVNTRLVDVENATVKSQGSRLSEKQTSTVRLGEAKLHLLWKQLDYSLGRDFPGVKVSKGDAGQLVLEGSVEEILQATDCISKKESLVFERPVSDKSPHFLAFLRNSYGSPGKLGEFLGVDGKVEIELRDTELRLFTLLADKLNDTEKTLRDKFKEVKLDVPNCSSVPSELQMKLKSKVNQMNQGQCRAQVLFGLDSTVCLLGHTEEVEELSETVIQFILDQASIEGSVILPFQELVQLLPELLQLHGFDYSGVVFHPLPFSSEPMVALEGPSSKVTEVRNRLGPFLDSVVQDKVIIDLPGAERYFASPSGRDKLLNVARLQKCVIQLQKQPRIPRCNLASGVTAVASYSLCDGLQVLVCQGDITKQEADALVNAANENLDHGGGVAALSKAGGPEVEMESKALIKYIGKVPTGDVVVTTGGNLKCKKLLHAVGPVGGQADGKERVLLEKTVQSALKLAEMMEFKSIAMPCISSGLLGVPVTVCCEAIVTAVKIFGSQGGRSLRRIILIDNRGEVVRAMQEACDRFLQGISPGNSTPSDLGFQMGAAAQHTARGAPAGGSVHIEVIQGTIETQQVDVLVSPMVDHDPLSTRVGSILSKMVGSQLKARFRKAAGEDIAHGDAVLVEDLPGLPCKAVFFLSLMPWDDDQDGTAVQILRLGIYNILTSCEQRGFRSVALPVLGAGIALRFPDDVVARVLLEEVQAFAQTRATETPILVRVAIHPSDTDSAEVFRSVQESLQHKESTKGVCKPDYVSLTKRIVLLGKTGAGKSNLASTIFGEQLFTTNHSPNSGTRECQSETRAVNGRSITLIDTPGLFDANRPEEELKPEIMNCITECAPGPHVFLIVLKVDKFTEQEKAVVDKICQYFPEDTLKYAVIVFTHGDQLPKEMKIEEFVSQNQDLSELVKKCGDRCHVFDNKYWKNMQQNNYRSNQFQVEELLSTIDNMVMENNGDHYSNSMLQAVEEEIKKEEEQIKQSSGAMSPEEIRKQAKTTVSKRVLSQVAATTTGALLGAFLGVASMVDSVFKAVKNHAELIKLAKNAGPALGLVGAGNVVAVGAVVVAGVATAAAIKGAVEGAITAHNAAEEAETPWDATGKAVKAVIDRGKHT